MKRLLILVLALLLTSSALLGLDSPQIDVMNLRSKAMGGVHLTMFDDQYTIINNPAGTGLLKNAWISLVQVQAVLSGDLLEIWDHKDKLTSVIGGSSDIENDTWNFLSRLKIGFSTTPVYLAFLNVLPFNINLAVFNTLKLDMKTNPDIPIPTWDFTLYNDTVGVANFSMRLLGLKFFDLYAGVNVKLIHRVMFRKQRMDFFYIYNLTQLEMEDLDVYRGLALGMDIGFIAEFSKSLHASLTITDFYGTKFSWTKVDPSDFMGEGTPAGHEYIQPSVNIGGSLKIGTIIPALIENLVVAMDIRNFFDKDINLFIKTYIGAEFGMLGGVFKIRAGLYQGYISAGLGIDIPVLPIEFSFAYWGEEKGDFPGQNRIDNFGLTLNIVW